MYTLSTGASGTCGKQSIDGRLSFEGDESHQSGDLDETILTSSEDKASMVVSPASTTLQTKDTREQIVSFAESGALFNVRLTASTEGLAL